MQCSCDHGTTASRMRLAIVSHTRTDASTRRRPCLTLHHCPATTMYLVCAQHASAPSWWWPRACERARDPELTLRTPIGRAPRRPTVGIFVAPTRATSARHTHDARHTRVLYIGIGSHAGSWRPQPRGGVCVCARARGLPSGAAGSPAPLWPPTEPVGHQSMPLAAIGGRRVTPAGAS